MIEIKEIKLDNKISKEKIRNILKENNKKEIELKFAINNGEYYICIFTSISVRDAPFIEFGYKTLNWQNKPCYRYVDLLDYFDDKFYWTDINHLNNPNLSIEDDLFVDTIFDIVKYCNLKSFQ